MHILFICHMTLPSTLLFSSFLSLIKMSIASYTVQPIADDAALRDIRSDEPEKKPAIPRSWRSAAASEQTGKKRDMTKYEVMRKGDSLDKFEQRLSVLMDVQLAELAFESNYQ